MAAALCTRDDRVVWATSAHRSFAGDMKACAPGCIGAAKCTAACVARRQPRLTEGCVKAYGDLAQCTARRCWSQCMGGASARCEACVEASCNPEFFGSTGLPESFKDGGAPPAGAVCTKSDQKVWEKLAKDAFPDDMKACAPGCLGASKCTAACVARRQPGLTEGCVKAYGDLAQCTARRCWSQCVGGASARCEACVEASCNPEFFGSTGLKEPPRRAARAHAPPPAASYGSYGAMAVGAAVLLLLLLLLVVARRRVALSWRLYFRRTLFGRNGKARSSSRTSELPCSCHDVSDEEDLPVPKCSMATSMSSSDSLKDCSHRVHSHNASAHS
ncbi:hypothetical protein AB1Y20_005593 [Prymnesium parvum]|uniref:Uncharacterized protein n=1 Tax=Prymnesium parvum TaxID=97485 RepID=A0AB34J704_PRYPA